MQTNQTPEALAEEARGHAVRVAIHAYNRGMDDMSDDPLRAASANNHRDVQLAEAAALEACIDQLRNMAATQPQPEVEALYREVGRKMVEITTTVRGPDEWLCIPELWLQCMKERDDALSKLAAPTTGKCEPLTPDHPDLIPRGFLLQWPALGGKRHPVWNDTDAAAKSVGCPSEPLFALRGITGEQR